MFQVRAYEARTITWWYHRRGDIDFSPPFQRAGKLWNNKDKAFLIDSIINEYDFPKIYLADFSYTSNNLNSRKKLFSVIDGKQRLEAIFDFIDGKFKLSSEIVYEADPTIDLRELNYENLRNKFPKIAILFEQFNLPVMSVITDDSAKINQLFVRMNKNKSLTGAEIRNAMTGKASDAIRRIAEHDFISLKCSFNKSRGQDKNLAAKLLLIFYNGSFTDTKKNDLDNFVKIFQNSIEESQGTEKTLSISEKKLTRILDGMNKKFLANDPALNSSGLLPIFCKIAEEHGTEKIKEYIIFWKNLSGIDASVFSRIESITDYSRQIIRFNELKRNINDGSSNHRLFAFLSVEYIKFQIGLYEDLVKNINRLKLITRKTNEKSNTKK